MDFLPALVAPHFLAMLSIFSFFFMRGREALEMVVSTREEVDWETWSWGHRSGMSPHDGDTAESPQLPPRVSPCA